MPSPLPHAAPSMAGLSWLDELPFWFVAVPDEESARSALAALRQHAAQELSHPSGRPWVVGCWPDGAVTTGQAGTVKVAVLGQHQVRGDDLAEAAGRVRAIADLDRLAASLVGSSHLVASVEGRVRVQGTVTGLRRVFSAQVGGAAVAADRADVLAGLLDAGVDEPRLVLHLLDPHILYPLAGQPVWRGVEQLATDHYLVLDGDGRRRSVRWWSPPEPVVPMAEGAPALLEALSAAVDARTRGRELVSCDLGGLDSTSVCCLAARGEAEVVAYTAATRDPLADDVAWAGRTVAALGTVEHHVIPAEEVPLVFHGLHGAPDRFDEPFSATTERERWLAIARRAAARGSRLHLTGFGGDELLYGSVAHLHTLARTSPRTALHQLRGFAAKYRWPRGRLLRQLSDHSSYRQWLARVADTLTEPKPPLNEPLLDWGFTPRLPSWVTPAAVRTVADQIRAEVPAAEPLGHGRGQHRELETMKFVSRLTRQFGQLAAGVGVAMASPYYDDRVIEAGLAVRPLDRVTPWRYKPLVVEAMRGIVPAESLARETKANGSGDEEPGLRRYRSELLVLFEDSRLARLGLIDADALRHLLAGPLPPSLYFGALDQTVACEAWLRSLERAPVPSQERR
jgi:asparagine synthase (glutamine-hydrolysing)